MHFQRESAMENRCDAFRRPGCTRTIGSDAPLSSWKQIHEPRGRAIALSAATLSSARRRWRPRRVRLPAPRGALPAPPVSIPARCGLLGDLQVDRGVDLPPSCGVYSCRPHPSATPRVEITTSAALLDFRPSGSSQEPLFFSALRQCSNSTVGSQRNNISITETSLVGSILR